MKLTTLWLCAIAYVLTIVTVFVAICMTLNYCVN